MTTSRIDMATTSGPAGSSVPPVAVSVKPPEEFTVEGLWSVWDAIGSDWRPLRLDADQFWIVRAAEPRRQRRDRTTNVTDNPEPTASNIASPLLDDAADSYCTRLAAIAGNAVRSCREQIDNA